MISIKFCNKFFFVFIKCGNTKHDITYYVDIKNENMFVICLMIKIYIISYFEFKKIIILI